MRSVTAILPWVCWWLAVAAPNPAGDVFVTVQPANYQLPPDGDSLPVWIAAAGPELADVQLDILYILDPAGRAFHEGAAFAGDAEGSPATIASLDGAGRLVTLRIEPAHFSKAGDYRLAVRLSGRPQTGDGARVNQSLEWTLTREPGSLAVNDLPQGAVRLYRSWPLGCASHEQALRLRASGAGLANIDAKVQVTTGSGDDRITLGDVRSAFTPGDLALAPGENRSATLSLNGLDRTGSHQVSLSFTSATLAAPVAAVFKVIVTDYPIWALLAVFIGVLISFYLRYLAEVANPTIDLQLNLSAVRENLGQLLAKNPRHEELLSLRDRLNRIASDLATGNRESAGQALVAVRTELDEIRKKLKQRRQTLRDHLALRDRQIQRFREEAEKVTSPTADDASFFEAVPQMMARAETALNDMRTEAAQDAGGELDSAFANRIYHHMDLNLAQLGRELQEMQGKEAEALGKKVRALQATMADAKQDPFELWRGHVRLKLEGANLRSKHSSGFRATLGAQKAGQDLASIAGSEAVVAPTSAGEEPAEPGLDLNANRAQRKALVRERNRNQMLISLVALILAAAIGFANLYDGTTAFGSFSDYATALAWGFGFDNGVRGVGSVLTQLRGGGG